jgi:hypothetical protein
MTAIKYLGLYKKGKIDKIIAEKIQKGSNMHFLKYLQI